MWEPLRTGCGRVTLRVYNEKGLVMWGKGGARPERHAGKNHTRGEAGTGHAGGEGNAIPMGMGHPVRPALVTPAPLFLL